MGELYDTERSYVESLQILTEVSRRDELVHLFDCVRGVRGVLSLPAGEPNTAHKTPPNSARVRRRTTTSDRDSISEHPALLSFDEHQQ